MGWSIEGIATLGEAADVTDDAAWLRACAAMEEGDALVLRQGDILLPLCLRKRHGLVTAQCLGQDSRSAAGPIGTGSMPPPPLSPGDIPGQPDLIDFRRIPGDCLEALFPDQPSRLARRDILHFGRPIGDSEDAFLAPLSKGARKDLRYTITRAGKTFGQDRVRRRGYRLDEDNWDAIWSEAEAFSRHTWQGQAGVSVLADPGKRSFFRELMRHGLAVAIHFQDFGETLAAAAVTMEHGDQLLIYAHEYHTAQAKYQPGHILNHAVIVDAMARGIRRLDFGVGSTQHKYEWKCEPRELWRIMLPRTWKGRLALAYQKARWSLGAMRQSMGKA